MQVAVRRIFLFVIGFILMTGMFYYFYKTDEKVCHEQMIASVFKVGSICGEN